MAKSRLSDLSDAENKLGEESTDQPKAPEPKAATPTETVEFYHEGAAPEWFEIAGPGHKNVHLSSSAVNIIRVQDEKPTEERGIGVGKHGFKLQGAGTRVWAFINPKVRVFVIRGEGALSTLT